MKTKRCSWRIAGLALLAGSWASAQSNVTEIPSVRGVPVSRAQASAKPTAAPTGPLTFRAAEYECYDGNGGALVLPGRCLTEQEWGQKLDRLCADHCHKVHIHGRTIRKCGANSVHLARPCP